jgi:hypothetical protein
MVRCAWKIRLRILYNYFSFIKEVNYITSLSVKNVRNRLYNAFSKSDYYGVIITLVENPGGYPAVSMSFSPWY